MNHAKAHTNELARYEKLYINGSWVAPLDGDVMDASLPKGSRSGAWK
jgi:hypothetical protein